MVRCESPSNIQTLATSYCPQMATHESNINEDDAPCMRCSDLVNKESMSLQCDLCSGWAHITCADVSSKAYSTLQSLKGSVWLCVICQESFTRFPKEISALRSENSVLRTQLSELINLPSIVESKQQKLEALLQELEFVKGGKDQCLVERRRRRSSPLPMAAHNGIIITNRFTPLNTLE